MTDAVLEEAKDLRRAIVAGEVSFAEAARRHSVAPSAEQGGRLGFVKRHGAMDEAFSRAAFGLDVGGVSEPVRTRFGVHLIRCDEVKPGTKGLADVREQVVEALARQLLEKLARLEARRTPVAFTASKVVLVSDVLALSTSPLASSVSVITLTSFQAPGEKHPQACCLRVTPVSWARLNAGLRPASSERIKMYLTTRGKMLSPGSVSRGETQTQGH